MNLYEFENKLNDGFKLSNLILSKSLFLKELKKYKAQKQKNSYFFYKNELLTYFANEEIKFDLKPSYTCVMFKNQKDFDKHKKFLSLNNFQIFSKFKQMVLKKESINYELKNFSFLQKAESEDLSEVYAFFTKFFDKDFLFLCSLDELNDKETHIYVYKENAKIKGALFFRFYLNTAFLEFIAVEKDLKFKNVAWALMNILFMQECKNFKLFVNENNHKAINFYKRSGFNFSATSLIFLRNF